MTTAARKTGTLRLLVALALVAGCQVPQRHQPLPFTTTVAPNPMMSSTASTGNCFIITAAVSTNRPDWPACDQFGIPIPKRVHLQLSTDGGSNYTRYIAYGIPVVTNTVVYAWSIPWWDETIITEHARIELTDMAGERVGHSIADFTIAGLFVDAPQGGSLLTHGANLELDWHEAGGGKTNEVGYITPTIPYTALFTLTNCLAGANAYNWRVNGLPYPTNQLRIVIRSSAHPIVWGWSGILSTQ